MEKIKEFIEELNELNEKNMGRMTLFKISHDKFIYDTYDGHIVAAHSVSEVVPMVKKIENRDIWDTATIERIGIYTGKETEPFILLSSYNAG